MIMQSLLADRTQGMKASAIREILKAADRPGLVSLGGGIPAPESFPLDIMDQLMNSVMEKYRTTAFQYGSTEGFGPFRMAVSDYLGKKGLEVNPEDVLVSSGSQGILDGLGKILIDPGDRIAVESPTYLGAIQAFSPYEPSFLKLETDDLGVIPECFEKTLKDCRPKFVYLVPTFQNPTGRTIPLERRRAIARIVTDLDLLVVEDDPYQELRFRGTPVPSLKSLIPDHVVYIGSMSKIFAPGLRLGFCAAPQPLSRWLVLAKQGVDLHSSTLSQALAAEYLSGNFLEKRLPGVIGLYQARQSAMLKALERYFPDGFRWTEPEGGMFLWVEAPSGWDMDQVYPRALDQGVAFVPGRYFFTTPGEGLETMRLNYSHSDEDTIERAIRILAEAFKKG